MHKMTQLDFFEALDGIPNLFDLLAPTFKVDKSVLGENKRLKQMEFSFSDNGTELSGSLHDQSSVVECADNNSAFSPNAYEKVLCSKKDLPAFQPDCKVWIKVNNSYFIHKIDGWLYFLDRCKGEFRPVSKSSYYNVLCEVASAR